MGWSIGSARLRGIGAIAIGLCLIVLVGAPEAGAAPNWTQVDTAGQQILDVDADRVLYMPTTGLSATLAVKDRDSGIVTPIPLGSGMNPWGAFLTPFGVVIATSEPPGVGALYEWRPGSAPERLGALTGYQLKAVGNYVLWGARSGTFEPLMLHRRDLSANTNVDLGSGVSGGSHDLYDDWAGSDLAANGDVALWKPDGIYRHRAGTTTKVGAAPDPDSDSHPRFPRTDGQNIVWATWTYATRGSLRGNGASGDFTLDSFTTTTAYKEPTPDYDYRVAGGWAAFTKGAEFAEQVWTRSPAGVETAVSPAGGYEIAGLSADGEVVYGTYDSGNNNVNAFLARPGQAPVEVGRTWDNQLLGRGFGNHVFKLGDHWYSIAFGSLRRLQLTDAPVGGSQTTIDSGPQGTDSDTSPTFTFSSTAGSATFECRLDSGDWDDCDSPHTYTSLADGKHTFLVRSAAPGGAVDPEPASQTWTIDDDDDAPAPFALIAPADGATTTDSTPTLSWQVATDAGSGVDHYEVWIDGTRVAEPTATEFTPPAALSDGGHVWDVHAVDGNGNDRAAGMRTFRIDTTAPVASLGASPNPALTGQAVTFDAGGSNDPGPGTVARYEWDLDGDGTFERDTGAASSTSRSYAVRGEFRPAVRVTDGAGHSSTQAVELSVRHAPPAGRAGVSIDDGARFTRDRDVTVRVIWPPLATTVLLSNDGGFDGAGEFPVAERVPWRLDASGAERLPRTIYARFEGLPGRETYQDDIIVDTKAPRVIVAEFTSKTAAASLGGAALRTYRLRLKGRDALSGLARMQITTNRKHPGAQLEYRNYTKFRARSSRIHVRVQDGAGNWSNWRRVAR